MTFWGYAGLGDTAQDWVDEESEEDSTYTENEAFRTEEFDGNIDWWSWFTTNGDESQLDIYQDDGKIIFEMYDDDIWAYFNVQRILL